MAAKSTALSLHEIDLPSVNKLYNLCQNFYTMRSIVNEKNIVIPCEGDIFFAFAFVVDSKDTNTFLQNITDCSFSNNQFFESKFENSGSILLDILYSLDAIKYFKDKAVIQLSRLFFKPQNPLVLNITELEYKFVVNFSALINCQIMIQDFNLNTIHSNGKLQILHNQMESEFRRLFGGETHLVSYPFTISKWTMKTHVHKWGKRIVLPFEQPRKKQLLLIKINNTNSTDPLPIIGIEIANRCYNAKQIFEQSNHPFFNTTFSNLHLKELDKLHLGLPLALHVLIISYLQLHLHNSHIYPFDIDETFKFPLKIVIVLNKEKKDLEITLGYFSTENYNFKRNTYWGAYRDNSDDSIPTGRTKTARWETDSEDEEFFEPTTSMVPQPG